MGGDHNCPVCQATFTRPQHVARHMRSRRFRLPRSTPSTHSWLQTRATVRTNASTVETNLQEGSSVSTFSFDHLTHLAPCPLATCSLAISINATPTKSLFPTSPRAVAERALPLPLAQPPPSRPVTNVSSPVSHAMGPTHAVRSPPFPIIVRSCHFALLPYPGILSCADLLAKCISRKCRCTYVKFHRQTAPSGPGHHPPRSPSSSSSSLGGSVGSSRLPSSHLDGFSLAPPSALPSVTSASFPGPDQIFNTPFTFNPAAPAYPPNWTAADMSQLPFSMASDVDMSGKYRTQPDFVRRTGPPILSSGAPTVVPNMYANQQSQPPSSNWYPTWGEPGTYPPMDDTKSFDGVARTHPLTSSEPSSFASDFYGAGLIGSAYRPRRMSLDFSDSSSATSQSVPSSATSSSVHLPLPENEMYDSSEEIQRRTHDEHILQHQRRSSMPTSLPTTFPPPSDPSQVPSTQQPPRTGEGSFSAFDLMSTNMLAGLASDGVPFFSNLGMGLLPHSPNATPMPTRVQHAHAHQNRDRGMSLGALPTPGLTKDTGDARELKDMWKTYLRSPLSGSGTATLDLPSLGQLPQSPSGRRRVRVSSLPSVTPTVEKGQPMMANDRHGEVGAGSVRTTMHGHGDDLRSYEAAVNARSGSLNLNLVPRRKGTRPSLRASPPGEEMGGAPSGVVGMGPGDQQGISRPSSSSSSSSFAQAFTMPSPPHHHLHPNPPNHTHTHPYTHTHGHGYGPGPGVVKPPPMQGASISLPIPPAMSMSGLHTNAHAIGFGSSTSLTFEPGSRASSVTSDGTGTGGSGSDGEVFRPSFKRYASQTLGPLSSKRALVERGGGRGESNVGVDKGIKGKARDGAEGHGMEGLECVGGGGSPGSRPIVALPERAKRG